MNPNEKTLVHEDFEINLTDNAWKGHLELIELTDIKDTEFSVWNSSVGDVSTRKEVKGYGIFLKRPSPINQLEFESNYFPILVKFREKYVDF